MLFVDLKKLFAYVEEPAAGFDQTVQQMRMPLTECTRRLLVYIDKVLEHHYMRADVQDFHCIHLHFPEIPEEIKNLLLEFLTIRLFHQTMERDKEADDYIRKRLTSLNNKLARNIAPADAKAAKGGNLAFRKWQVTKNEQKAEIAFLQSLPPNKGLRPQILFNVLINDLNPLEGSFYAMSLENWRSTAGKRTYGLLSTEEDIQGVLGVLHETDPLAAIRQVLLFDSDIRKNAQTFNRATLRLMRDRGYPVERLILFSFDKRPFRMRALISRLGTIYSRFLVPPQPSLNFGYSYLFEQEEVARLLGLKNNIRPTRRIGRPSELYTDLLQLTKDLGVDKLRSPSVVNIYAMAINRGLADMMMADLFKEGAASGRSSENAAPTLFPEEAISAVQALAPDEREELRKNLDQVLDLVIGEWEELRKFLRTLNGKSVGLVVPLGVMGSSRFRRELKELLPDRTVKLYTWKEVREEACLEKQLFILAYRDAGRFPFDIYPSLLEGRLDANGVVGSAFLNMLFGERFDHASFNYDRIKAKVFANRLRYDHFDWKGLEERIEATRPLGQPDEQEEEDDEIPDTTESIKVRYTDGSSGSYTPSRLMVVQRQADKDLSVMRMDELSKEGTSISIQPLDELYLDLNPFQVTPGNEKELQVIKAQHAVLDPGQTLWKVLLVRRKEQLGGSKVLYEEIEQVMNEKAFVQYGYFKDHWLNVDNDLLVPRKRRHFRRLCDHLKLPTAYYRLELKKRASLVNSSRQSTVRMNGLLQQLFLKGLFRSDVDTATIDLRQLIDAYDLEEVGIDEDNVNSELSALAELLKEKLSLKQVQKIDLI